MKGTFLEKGIQSHLIKRVCGNPTVTHAPYLHPPSWLLSCLLCLFQNDSSNGPCSSETKHCLVKQCMTWPHTQHLLGKAFVTIMLMPQEQCLSCKIQKCQIYLCLSNSNPFLSHSALWCMETGLPLPLQQMTDIIFILRDRNRARVLKWDTRMTDKS